MISRSEHAAVLLMCLMTLGACGEPEPMIEQARSEITQIDGQFIPRSEHKGRSVVVAGRVSGRALPHGFFLRVDGDRLVFVQTTDVVRLDDSVQVAGTLQPMEIPVFDEWEFQALGRPVRPDWDVMRAWYIEAREVLGS